MDTNYSHIYLRLKIYNIEFITTLCYQIALCTMEDIKQGSMTESDGRGYFRKSGQGRTP